MSAHASLNRVELHVDGRDFEVTIEERTPRLEVTKADSIGREFIASGDLRALTPADVERIAAALLLFHGSRAEVKAPPDLAGASFP